MGSWSALDQELKRSYPELDDERRSAVVDAIELLRSAGDNLEDAVYPWYSDADGPDLDQVANALRDVFDSLIDAAHAIVGPDRSVTRTEVALRVTQAQVAAMAVALGADAELFAIGGPGDATTPPDAEA